MVFFKYFSGKTGSVELSSKMISGRGSKASEGIKSVEVTSRYYYKSIADTSYSVCLVVGIDEQYQDLVDQPRVGGVHFHRFDLLPPDDQPETCSAFGRIVTKGESLVGIPILSSENRNQEFVGSMN